MDDRLVFEDRVVHLLHLKRADAAAAYDRDLAPPVIVVDIKTVGRLADVAALEARHA